MSARYVTGIKLSQSSVTLSKGSTITLTCSIEPSNPSEYEIAWFSNNLTVVQVEPTGLSCKVKAISDGETTITALETFSSKIANCNVCVASVQNLYAGNTAITDLYYGNSQISEMYLGNVLILNTNKNLKAVNKLKKNER